MTFGSKNNQWWWWSSSSSSAWTTTMMMSGIAGAAASAWLGRQQQQRQLSSKSSRSDWPMLIGWMGLSSCSLLLLWNGILRIPIGASRRQQQQRRLLSYEPSSNNVNDDPQNDVRRRLGLLERWYVARSRAGIPTTIMIVMEFELSQQDSKNNNNNNNNNVPPPPKLAEIRKYLQRVSTKFSWLRCKVRRDGVDGIDDNKNYENTNTPEDDEKNGSMLWGDDLYVEPWNELCQPHARQVILPSDVDFFNGVTQIVNEESTKRWHDENPAKPLWRATSIVKHDSRKFAIILSFHHLLTDGVGAMEVAQAFLDASNGKLVTLSPSDAGTYLPPPMEDIMDTVPQLRHLLMPFLLDRFPKLLKYIWPRHWNGNPIRQSDTTNGKNEKAQLIRIALVEDAVTMDRLRQYSTKHNISMNSLVSATLIKAISKVVDYPKRLLFKIQVPVDERRRRVRDVVAAEDLGVYLTAPQFYVNVSATHAVPYIGKCFQKKLQNSLATSNMDIGLLEFIRGDWVYYLKKSCLDGSANSHPSSLEISHLNSIDSLKGGKWKISSVWLAQGHQGCHGSTIKASLISTRTNMMTATLTSTPEAVPLETLMNIANEWKSELNNVI